ncbi:MAG: glutamyl-tRNA reductase [Pseudomonadales bacterium]
MELIIVGVNHQTAPVALREKIAFTPEQLGPALQDLASQQSIDEVSILSTCNRTEIYAITEPDQAEFLAHWLAEYHQEPQQLLDASIYRHQGDAALAHLMRVAIGLDSMILGEPQILGQLKDSFNTAATYKVMGQQLHRISQNTYRVAKSVRTETAIGESTVSAASTAVDLANQLFADLKTCRALLVGAGETIEIVARHLQAAGVQQLVIANRTIQNALALANEVGGVATILNDLPNQLLDADIVITSTASDLPIIGKGMAERALKARRHRPIFMVDLAVPRDIEPEVNELRDVYLYSIDDLQQIIADNLSTRAEAATAAEAMIQTAVVEFSREDKSREITDILVKFRQKHESIKQAELAKALKRLEKGEDPVDVLTGLANQLTNKIIHNPSVQMKQAKADGREDILGAINDLFDLEP